MKKQNEDAINGKGVESIEKADMLMTHFLVFVKHLPKSWSAFCLIKWIQEENQRVKFMF